MMGIHKNERGSHVVALVLLVVVIGAVGFAGYRVMNKDKNKPDTNSAQFAGDAVTRGKYLSHDQCEGEGSKKLGSAPMKMADVSTILPYGLMVGGHVTPVDHQYYYGKNQKAAANTYDVMAPGDGTLVNVEVRPKATGPADVRGVISYSCTFFSYFDLTNSLSPEIANSMPAGWETKNGPQKIKIAVKEGQVIAKVGGQSLDFAVWDTTKNLKGLLVPAAYNNYEPWKINTAQPLDYYTDAVKNEVLPYYVRKAEPRDGRLDYDVDGKAVGSWFKQGTNGYIGAFKEAEFNSMSYADGHLSLAPDYLDPSGWVFSTGAVSHGSQYTIKSPSVAPDKLDEKSGVVKYELAPLEHNDQTGSRWMGTSVPASVKLSTTGQTMGTVLVELKGKRELKVEVFLGKNPSQVSSFTSAAITYDRGDKATTMMGPDQR
ncbi:MAG TPA: hypothetical protein VK694_07950 [Verrucomicrobiae bacterium]|nr:hypothetical protein [Verrucomicrobiae bacterium]